jgi:23S rRNA (guanine2069-N7)-methyltransferase / 23S rRNA (guanine2445-N2)-methyltransferase
VTKIIHRFFANCPKNMGELSAVEIKELGGSEIKTAPAGVSFSGDLETAYKILIWSRISGRVFLELSQFEAESPDSIYENTGIIDWNKEMNLNTTFSISCDLINSSVVNHPNFASQRVKDAIVDQFRNLSGERPSVDSENPDLKIHLLLKYNQGTISIELTNNSLHKRGYRKSGGPATLKENLAAAMLIRSDWKQIAEDGGSFLDLFCGTGTLPIEAALIAGDIAPALVSRSEGPAGWLKHDNDLWEKLIEEAQARKISGQQKIQTIVGWDNNKTAVNSALFNVEAAGLTGLVHIEKRDIERYDMYTAQPGLIVSNPPYGERLGDIEELFPLYQTIGKRLTENFKGWKAVILSGNEQLSRSIGLKPDKVNNILNGKIECTLATYSIYSEKERIKIKEEILKKNKGSRPLSAGAEMFSNRLKKNLKKLKKWSVNNGISCYRIYDADMPEYSAAIDYYDEKWVNVQEYAAPSEIEREKTDRHLKEILEGLTHTLNLHKKQIFIKTRKKQTGSSQYERLAMKGEKQIILENGKQFLVNFSDYLDTGIFLDHRITRELIGELSDKKDFLNLFAYTGTATVYAAAGGAKTTTSVDNSKTYTQWSEENMVLNGFDTGNHQFIKEDCFKWLTTDKSSYDLIFLDPPTFSNSKSSSRTLDIQRDHVELIKTCAKKLKNDGTLIFSTNFRKFKLDIELLNNLVIEDITYKTIPEDYERNKKIHYCWNIKRIK